VLGHQFSRVLGRVVLETADDLHRHDITGDSLLRILGFRYRSHRDVPIGYHTDQPVAFENRHEADPALTHSARQLAKRRIRFRRLDVPDEDLAHVDFVPSLLRSCGPRRQWQRSRLDVE
jgi:hypothetical protein